MSSSSPPILSIHTPSSSFAIIHSVTQESLLQLYDKLSRKLYTDYRGARVGPGWLKYTWNESIWNLDDEADYTIFVWRTKSSSTSPPSQPEPSQPLSEPQSSSPSATLHLHNPSTPLPTPPAYLNPSYYLFQPSRAHVPSPSRAHSTKSKSIRSKKGKGGMDSDDENGGSGILKHKKAFDKFHSENGVRTVKGSIGPVQNVRMLLKSGYRHVYISRKFAMKHGFIPSDAAPGHYGYGGLVNIGTWPITLTPSSSSSSPPPAGASGPSNSTPHDKPKPKATQIAVYLSEEPHFDVVLGRSFFEKRCIKTSSIDMTDVVCLDTGEKIECEVVVLRDGRGGIVSVT